MARQQIAAIILFILAIAVGKIGRELYRWHASAPERAELLRLGGVLEDAGVEVVRTQLKANRLRDEIAQLDGALRQFRGTLSQQELRIFGSRLPVGLYDDYLFRVESYNGSLRARNERIREWREVIALNHEQVDRYNAVADTIRAVAARLGEPYYPIPIPAEVAVRRGLVPENTRLPRSAAATP